MIECIVDMLVKKYNIQRDVAFIFYMDVMNKYKLEHLITSIDKFDCFEALRTYLLGGK
jgi:hypothetical protein